MQLIGDFRDVYPTRLNTISKDILSFSSADDPLLSCTLIVFHGAVFFSSSWIASRKKWRQ